MEAILSLLLAGSIARTTGIWGYTRYAAMLTAVFAILLDFTPLRPSLGPFARWVFTAMLVLWLTNLLMTRRTKAA